MVLYCRCMIVLSISFVSFRYVTLRWFLSICSFLRFRISLARSLIRSFALVRTSFRGWLALWCFSHTGLYLPSQRKTFYCVRSLLFLQERKKSAGVSRKAVRCLSLSDSLSLELSPLARFLASTLLHGEREHFDFAFTIYLDIYGCSLVSFIQPALPMSWP